MCRWGIHHYELPVEVPHTSLDNPTITIGSWVHFPSLDFGGDPQDWSIHQARVRLWPYDGTNIPTAQQIKTIGYNSASPDYAYGYESAERDARATFKLAPGTYAVVIEGQVPEFDQNGQEIEGSGVWVDISAGTYTLFLVDSNRLARYTSFDTIERLQSNVLVCDYTSHGIDTEFQIEDGKVTTVEDEGFKVSSWNATDLVNRDKSSVSISTNFKNSVSVQVHAELEKGASISKDAYFEVVTNQESRQWGQGYMNPKALTINGKTLSINRWENLFNQTQCMGDGSLTILLGEAKKQGASCATFPMDLTLVIPCTNTSGVEASVWLVSNGKRSLVGSYAKESHEVSICVPSLVAWKTFYVYGETGPNANVTVCLDGMRAATTRSDAYGYYTAQITLPDDAQDFDEFTISAAAQWLRAEAACTATSKAQTVIYTTSFPVVERITLCYQPDVDEDYEAVLAYNRGAQPSKYVRLYRAEHDNNNDSDNHAKYFWIVEFANGNNMKSTTVNVHRQGAHACAHGKVNPLAASAVKKVVSAKYSKSKAVATAANVKVSKAQGAVTFSNASADATARKFKVDAKTGKVTVPKATKKGKYAVVIAVTAAGNKSYLPATKTVSYTLQVK